MNLLRHKKSERGVATVLIVLVLSVFILAFIVVGIDFAYVYAVRGQLQNAVDAAALAGAAALNNDIYDTLQTEARDEAKKFAAENIAAGDPVVLEDVDIEVGFWDGSIFNSVAEGAPIINAIKVTAKRIQDRNNAVRLYFGGLVGWPEMDIVRVAIASKPARADAPITLCIQTCDPPIGVGIVNAPDGTRFDWTQGAADPSSFALTDFSEHVSTPDIIEYTCGKVFDTCYAIIDTTQGAPEPVLRQLRCAFLNPLYDSEHKTCVRDDNNDGKASPGEPSVSCTNAGLNVIVTSWSPLVPLLEDCATPTYQPPSPYKITGYARAKIVDVYHRTPVPSGGGNNCACETLFGGGYSFIDPPTYRLIFDDPDKPALIINGITCVKCDDPGMPELLGKRAFLVK